MTKVDMAARTERTVNDLVRKITVALKKQGKFYGPVEHSVVAGVHYITADNGLGGFSDEMRWIVRGSTFAVLKDYGDVEGHYDWASKTYAPEYSWVSFTI